MNGFVLLDSRTGSHIVSQATVKRFGLASGDGDSDAQSQAIAGMVFGLLVNSQEAVGDFSLDGHLHGEDGVDPTEELHRRLDEAGLSWGHPLDDRSLNAAHIETIMLGSNTLFIFQHSVFPVTGSVIVPLLSADENAVTSHFDSLRLGTFLVERVVKAFCHRFGLDYVQARANGVAKPFRKLFLPLVAECVFAAISNALAALCGIVHPNPLRILPPEGLFLALAATRGDQGRWILSGKVTNAGADWVVVFGTEEQLNDPVLASRLRAFDQLRTDLAHPSEAGPAADSTTEGYQDVRAEINAGSSHSFAVMEVPGVDCVALSSNRLVALENLLLCSSGLAAETIRLVRSLVHVLAKMRTGVDSALAVVVNLDG